MASTSMCGTHDEEALYMCGWCSTRICDSCVAEANGKKYCSRCAMRFKSKIQDRPLVRNVSSKMDPREVRVVRDGNAKRFGR
ncbi:MAG: hypothetical protein ABIA93_04615 [Candidatus Woesearchaeota archaeon]